jgi:cyclopropane fatty-acyl-phospholipid synthase-like methyltransferase
VSAFAGLTTFARSYLAQEAPDADLHAKIRSYYEQCDWHYRLICGDRDNLALHYGYWDAETRTHADAVVRMNRALADAADVRPGDRILDAGCGNGGSSLWLARERGATCLGLTLVPTQAERGNRHAERRGLAERCRLKVADYGRTGLDDASFDLVWAQESLCHAPHKREVLREWRRLLAPGGRVMISDGFRTRRDAPPDDDAILRTWLDGWVIPDLATVPELMADLEAAGFTDVVIQDMSAAILPDAERMGRLAAAATGASRRLGVDRWIRARERGNVDGAVAQREALRRGAWRHVCITGRVAG